MKQAKKERGRGPAPKYGAKTIVKSVRMPSTLWDRLGDLADKAGVSRNEIIVRTMVRKADRGLR